MRKVGVGQLKNATRGAGSKVQREKLRDMNRKYHAGPDPLDREFLLDTIQPQSKDELKSMTAHLDKMFADGTPQQKQALEMWKFQAASGSVKDVVRLEFMRRFYFWLLGRGDEEDTKKTLWGRGNAAAHNSEVSAYIEQFVNKRTEYALKLSQLSQRVPDSLNGYYLYFKYIVNGALERKEKDGMSYWDMSQEDYLEDFDMFKQVFSKKTLLGGEEVETAYADIIRPMADYRGKERPYDGHVPFPVIPGNMDAKDTKGVNVSALSQKDMVENAAASLNKSFNISSKSGGGDGASFDASSREEDKGDRPPGTSDLEGGGGAPPPVPPTGGVGPSPADAVSGGEVASIIAEESSISFEPEDDLLEPVGFYKRKAGQVVEQMAEPVRKYLDGLYGAVERDPSLSSAGEATHHEKVADIIMASSQHPQLRAYAEAAYDLARRMRVDEAPFTAAKTLGKGKEEASSTPMKRHVSFDKTLPDRSDFTFNDSDVKINLSKVMNQAQLDISLHKGGDSFEQAMKTAKAFADESFEKGASLTDKSQKMIAHMEDLIQQRDSYEEKSANASYEALKIQYAELKALMDKRIEKASADLDESLSQADDAVNQAEYAEWEAEELGKYKKEYAAIDALDIPDKGKGGKAGKKSGLTTIFNNLKKKKRAELGIDTMKADKGEAINSDSEISTDSASQLSGSFMINDDESDRSFAAESSSASESMSSASDSLNESADADKVWNHKPTKEKLNANAQGQIVKQVKDKALFIKDRDFLTHNAGSGVTPQLVLANPETGKIVMQNFKDHESLSEWIYNNRDKRPDNDFKKRFEAALREGYSKLDGAYSDSANLGNTLIRVLPNGFIDLKFIDFGKRTGNVNVDDSVIRFYNAEGFVLKPK
jgi:hypothetical protein